MSDQDKRQLIDDAADIFIRLRDAPEDADLLRARDAFLARGEEERAAWDRLARIWGTRPQKRRRRTPLLPLLFIVAGGLAAMLYGQDARLNFLADAQTGATPAQVALASGDIAHLDAGSALVDDTADDKREVTLLAGTAFFEVEASADRRFTVTAGALTASALGTAFEVSRLGETVHVAVSEGRVAVLAAGRNFQLQGGDRLQWQEGESASLSEFKPSTIAPWRRNRLLADGLTVAQVAAIIDRRLAGRVFVIGGDGADMRVSGNFDLSKPLSALRALAAVYDARVYRAPAFVTVLRMP
ncbi:MAG: FecR domain-containing protein [Pseudomonadota bacterium]